MNLNREIKHITSLMDEDLLSLLQDNNAIIAGGALTSVFTNSEINDIDVYFRDAKSFSNVMRDIAVDHENVNITEACITHYTNKSILIRSGKAQVQLIAYKFFPTVEDIFNAFDFTINMAAIELHPEGIERFMFVSDANFLKHCAQKYLDFNEGTSYPLVSALRVQKYKERGYSISKAQMLRILLKICDLDIKDWDTLLDHLGSMYGLKPDEIFDTSQPFSLQSALDQLDKIDVIPDKMYTEVKLEWEDIYKAFEGKWDSLTDEWMASGKEVTTPKHYGYGGYTYIDRKDF